MGIIEKILKMGSRQDDNDDKVIDLSDGSQYPASVLADLDCTFALGDVCCASATGRMATSRFLSSTLL